jgi:hypothetical protein
MTVYAATGPTSHFNQVTTTSLVSVVLAKLPYDEISRPTRFRSGGAHGIDSIFAQEARRLWPDVPLEFVLARKRELQQDTRRPHGQERPAGHSDVRTGPRSRLHGE